jgi:hypothetical protein
MAPDREPFVQFCNLDLMNNRNADHRRRTIPAQLITNIEKRYRLGEFSGRARSPGHRKPPWSIASYSGDRIEDRPTSNAPACNKKEEIVPRCRPVHITFGSAVRGSPRVG